VVTAVVSDLHLGTRSRADLVSRPEIRQVLLDELRAADQLVLLGDSLDLRAGPPRDVFMASARFFEDLGEALAGGRVVVAAGNHDHQLAQPWLARHATEHGPAALGLEQVSRPARGDPLDWLARRMPRTELVLAYPGLWLRRDVYATHGHYLDCHNRVPTFECIAREVTERLVREPRDGYRTPRDYEAVLGPLYRAIYRVTQSRRAQAGARVTRRLIKAWERTALGRDAAGVKVRRPGVSAMAAVADGLAIEASHVLFGHLHRPGGDAGEWVTPGGRRLVNTGSWVYEPAYLGATPADSLHWPGTCALVADDGPPVLKQLLHGVTHSLLAADR
jgi:UDP-2,3-diacylglucosamine pyrophosphatase LpxH